MPILSHEPMIYPAGLLDEPPAAGTSPDDRPVESRFIEETGEVGWFVAHTKPRQEKALARYLFAREIPYFAPQYTRPLPYHCNRAASWIPLFPGYVFVKTNEPGRLEALQSNRIAAPLRVIDQVRLVEDLRHVKRIIDSRLPLYPEERLRPGRRVRIVFGPLAGLEGTIENQLGRCRFTVVVDFIRQGVSVEVDARALEPKEAWTEACVTT